MKSLNRKRLQVVAQLRDLGGPTASRGGSVKVRLVRGRLIACRCLAGNEGQTLVEMALLLPLLMLLVTGILSIGFAYSNQQALTQATGIAAQNLSASRSSSTDPCAEVLTAIKGAAPQLDLSKISINLTMNGTTVSSISSVNSSSCTSAESDMQTTNGAGGSITVYAAYPCNIGVVGVNFSSGCKLQAQVTEYEY